MWKLLRQSIKIQALLAGLLILVAVEVQAVPLLVEPAGPHSDINIWPANSQGMHWQQVYDDSFFGASPITINSFGFRGVNGFNGPVSFGPEFVIRMSTTTNEPGSLSTTFANNVGADNTVVKSGPISISSTFNVFTTFTLDTAFNFDPTMGNLLIEIEHNTDIGGSSVGFQAG